VSTGRSGVGSYAVGGGPQTRPFLPGRYLHGGPLPGASPLPVRYYELSICQVDLKAETITLLLDPFGAVEARLTIPLREEKAHG